MPRLYCLALLTITLGISACGAGKPSGPDLETIKSSFKGKAFGDHFFGTTPWIRLGDNPVIPKLEIVAEQATGNGIEYILHLEVQGSTGGNGRSCKVDSEYTCPLKVNAKFKQVGDQCLAESMELIEPFRYRGD